MFRCLQLARLGTGYVAPNPMVGAVIVHQNTIIGEGYHQRFGHTHAEPNAISAVKNKNLLKDATLYVNLEPCAHYGKTPPCANLIVQSGIPRVVVGTLDPNPKVSGKGINILEEAGVSVVSGVLADACWTLNKRFFIWQKEQRPFVLLKWAQSVDGFVDNIRTDNSLPPMQISNQITRQLTHKVRSQNQSILVSTNTAVLDNPRLSVRHWSGLDPIRVVLDRTGRIPSDYFLLDDSYKTLVFTETVRPATKNTEFISIRFDDHVIKNILTALAIRNIHSVLIEGGPTFINSVIDSGLWDEAQVEVSDVFCGEGIAAPALHTIPINVQYFDNQRILTYKNQKPNTISS